MGREVQADLADVDATTRAGAALARALVGGDSVALVGDLGAGKTTFVAGLVAELGGGAAASPTFSLINEYPGGRLRVWHVDLYRLERDAELVELGLDDIVGDRRGVVLVEWADKFPGVLPADHLQLTLTHEGDGRRLVATGTGPRSEALAAALAVR